MIENKKIALMADTVVNEKKIASHTAFIDAKTGVTFNTRYLDNDACREYRDIVRTDRAEIEDLAYDMQADFATVLAE